MSMDSQTIMWLVAAAFIVPLALGAVLRRFTSRLVAASIAAAALGLAALVFGPKQALLAAVWTFGWALLGASQTFLRLPTLDELSREAKSGRPRWWDQFGG